MEPIGFGEKVPMTVSLAGSQPIRKVHERGAGAGIGQKDA